MQGRDPAVLLDATAIPADRGGVGRYVDELAAALAAVGTPLSIACQRRDADHFGTLAPAARVVPVTPRLVGRAARMAYEQTGLPRLARRVGAQILHSPHYTVPLASPVPVVVTLHDALFFSHPQWHSAVKGRFFRTWTRVALRRAAECIVVSEATRTELVRAAGADPRRLTVAHEGVSADRFYPPTPGEITALRASLGIGDRAYVAFLGTLEPRKNVPALIRGFTAAVAGRSDPPVLLLAGGSGWDHDVEPALAAVPPGVQVRRVGYLPAELLPGFLGGAIVVGYPSLGEGFGLPVLEAMACGAAVLTTDRLSLPEVGGDAVAYTEPDAVAIGSALAGLFDDPARRRELSRRAITRAAGFTWAEHARRCREVYRRVAAT